MTSIAPMSYSQVASSAPKPSVPNPTSANIGPIGVRKTNALGPARARAAPVVLPESITWTLDPTIPIVEASSVEADIESNIEKQRLENPIERLIHVCQAWHKDEYYWTDIESQDNATTIKMNGIDSAVSKPLTIKFKYSNEPLVYKLDDTPDKYFVNQVSVDNHPPHKEFLSAEIILSTELVFNKKQCGCSYLKKRECLTCTKKPKMTNRQKHALAKFNGGVLPTVVECAECIKLQAEICESCQSQSSDTLSHHTVSNHCCYSENVIMCALNEMKSFQQKKDNKVASVSVTNKFTNTRVITKITVVYANPQTCATLCTKFEPLYNCHRDHVKDDENAQAGKSFMMTVPVDYSVV
jgi:hypothetical protein